MGERRHFFIKFIRSAASVLALSAGGLRPTAVPVAIAGSGPTGPQEKYSSDGGAWVLPELELSTLESGVQAPWSRTWEGGGSAASAMAAGLAGGGLGGTLLAEWKSLASTVSGVPGQSGTILGSGRRGDDVGVSTLSGVPLDPPQGGGFDINSLPAFLWAGATFLPGAAELSGAGIHRGAGSLTLTPWTEISGPPSTTVIAGFGSTGTGQVAAGRRWETGAAAMGGWQFGRQSGPALSLNLERDISRDWAVISRLLAASQTAELEGSRSYPTPGARQFSNRLLPSLEFVRKGRTADGDPDFRLALSADQLGLRYVDSANDVDTEDLSRRLRLAVDFDRLPSQHLGLEFSQSTLEQNLPLDARGTHGQWAGIATWTARWGGSNSDTSWRPQVRLVGLQSVGVHPEVALKWEAGKESPFVEAAWTRKFPTLLDRFYQFPPYFSGNPALEPESVASLRAATGTQHWGEGLLEAGAEGMLQRRWNLILSDGFETPWNGGNGWVGRLEPYWTIRGPGGWRGWSFTQRSAITWSRLDKGDGSVSPIPLQAAFRGGVTLRYAQGRWAGELGAKGSSALPRAGGRDLPPFAVASAAIDWRPGGVARLLREVAVSLRVDDFLDRKPEQIPDFRGPGRAFSVALSADLN